MWVSYLTSGCLAVWTVLGSVASAGVVLTPYRVSEVSVETRYPVRPFPNNPNYVVYVTDSDGDMSPLGAHVSKTAVRPDRPGESYGLAEAAAAFGKVRAGSEARTGEDNAKGTAMAAGAFGEGFVVTGGPANGKARITMRFEGRLDERYPSYGQFPFIGAWAWMDVTFWENVEGGGKLIHTVVYPNRLVSDSAVEGARASPVSALWEGETVRRTDVFEIPYEAGKDYFMEIRLETTAKYNGFARFMNSGSVAGFEVEPGASVSFASGTSLSAYNTGVPEPAGCVVALTALAFGLGRRGARALGVG